jgi:hypothetical protein
MGTITSVITKVAVYINKGNPRMDNVGDVTSRVRVPGPHAVAHRVHHHDLIGMTEYVSVLQERQEKQDKGKADLVVLHCDLREEKPDECKCKDGARVQLTSSYATRMCATPRALTRFSCACLFFLDHIQQRVWHAQVFYLSPEQSETVRTVSPYNRVRGKWSNTPCYRGCSTL